MEVVYKNEIVRYICRMYLYNAQKLSLLKSDMVLWKRSYINNLCLILLILCSLSNVQLSKAQSVYAPALAPTLPFHAANGPRMFTVTILGGANSSGSVGITLPVGYVFVPGSILATGVTATVGSFSANTATINLTGVPANGTNASFTYEAYAGCAAIGVEGNTASYIYTPSGGAALVAVETNSFNLLNAKINITNLLNSPSTAGVVGDSYTRSYRINNNGFGNIDTVYVTDVSGNGVQHVSHSVSNTNNGQTVDVNLVSAITAGVNTTYLYRFIVSSTPQDDHLGQNEYFTFTQQLKIASCTDLNTSLDAWYGVGPNAQPCLLQNDTQTTALALDNSKQPNLTVTVNPNSNNVAQSNKQLTCRGLATDQFYSVKNTGGAPARNITLRMYHVWGNTSNFQVNNSPKQDQVGFVLSSFKYKIPGGNASDDSYTTIPSSGTSGVHLSNLNYYTNASCINTTAPAWLDLVIPELAPGEEIFITYQDQNCCDVDCGGRLVLATQLREQYSNACGASIKNTLTSGLATQLRNGAGGNSNFTENFPTDVVEGQTYTLKWETTQASLVSELFPVGSTVRYEVTLPAGLVYDGTSPITMRTKTGQTATPTNVAYNGNVLNITFTTGQNNFTVVDTHNNAILSVPGISLNCSLAGGAASGAVGTRWIYKSVECASCEEVVICKSTPIAFHCSGSCATGLVNNGLNIIRKTYGNPDNANNGTPNGASLSSNVRTNWVSRGDLLDFTFLGTIADASAPVHNYKFGYAKFTIPDATATHFSSVGAAVKITNSNGSAVKVSLTNYPVTYTPTNGQAVVDFSIDKLVAAGVNNYTQFVDSDKVEITITLKVTDGIGGRLATTTVKSDFYVSDAANLDGSNGADKWFCGNFSGNYVLLGVLVPVRTPVTFSQNECAMISVNGGGGFNVGQHINNGGAGTNYYTDEYRQMGLPGDYTFTIPLGYEMVSMSFSYQRTSANYGFATAPSGNVLPDNIAGQVYTYNLRKQFVDQQGTWLLPDEGFGINFTAVLRPTCEASTSSRLDYSLVVIPGTQMTETFPVANFTVASYNTLNITKARIEVNANAPVQTVTGNTATWEVQIANTQPGTTPTVWMGEENSSANGITIQSVQQITAYGGSTVGSPISAGSNGLYQLGAYIQESKYYRITASFTSCTGDVLPLAVGYVCGSYPTSVASASCKNITNLSIVPTGANLQVSLIGQPVPKYPDSPGAPTGTVDLCDELEYTAEVKNPAQGTAYGLKFTVLKPAGVQYIANSFQLSPTILPATANLVAVNNDGTYVTETATTLTFTIPQSVVANLPYNSGYTIRYRARTVACDFISGTKMNLQALGVNGCGSPISGNRQQTQTIRIKGENLNPNSYVITSNVSESLAACGTTRPTYTFDAINSGPVATYAGESIRVKIPKPFTLGTIANISNLTSGAVPVVTSDATSTTYTWTMPVGIATGAHISFSAPLVVSESDLANVECGETLPIHEMIAYTFEASCQPSGPVCTGNLQAEGENEVTTIHVVRPSLSITNLTAAETGVGQISGIVTIANASATNGTTPQTGTLKLYQDTNANGIIDAGDNLLGSQTLALTTNASQAINYSVTTSYRGDICPLLAELTAECACTNPIVYELKCNISLPVTLQSFEVRKVETGIRLQWATTSETNSKSFEVQRSGDGKSWINIGSVKANGESSSIKPYNHTDNNPMNGLNYYRLKMVDADNSFGYSSIRSIMVDGKSLLAYPNPVIDRLNLSIANINDVASIEVINLGGTRVIKVDKPTQTFINMDKFKSGVYLLKIRYNSGLSIEQKVIKR